ncbi:zinc-binding dehydrogenase [Streptomyces hygroscopicus]|uniref:zinc-binding dehydrogenase n=1 Tax=Streptomyces hygroscopicus TaxID=1912 RepID=UPI0037A72136
MFVPGGLVPVVRCGGIDARLHWSAPPRRPSPTPSAGRLPGFGASAGLGHAGRRRPSPGGAGAVGNAAEQLARWTGARVVTTVRSPAKAALARAAGAHRVVDYRTQDAALVPAWR